MRRILLAGLCVALTMTVMASSPESKEKKWGVKLSGFVKTDMMVDTRQTVSAREGHFLLWPAAEKLDKNGKDINDKLNTNFLSLQSRLTVKITGPDAFGAKTSGVIEGDFFAQKNDNVNLFRMRHAFVKLNWEKSELMVGQYWNPLFITDCYPATISFNSGVPIVSFARNPQIRFTHKLGSFKLMGAAVTQRDHSSRGPEGVSSSYLRNAGVPDLHAQLHYGVTAANGVKLVTGVGMATKWIVPRLESNGYKVDEKVNGTSFIGFAKLTTKPLTFKVAASHGENLADVLNIGGFAVKEVKDAETGEQKYTPLTNTNMWTDIHTNGKKWQVGIFAGVTKNNGTKDKISATTNAVYGLGTDIKQLIRVSPRFFVNSGKMRFGVEWEHTVAKMVTSTKRDLNALPVDVKNITNNRFLASVYYFF
ncbi:hypothetical protein EMN47_19350 [Prolixibacteraceae bacterium JC049]|nr:hypothetical protein [Prolixibacteraceae bacterium JC049]